MVATWSRNCSGPRCAEQDSDRRSEIVTKCGIVYPAGRYSEASGKHYDTSAAHTYETRWNNRSVSWERTTSICF